jgi:hypothetical protein
MPRFPESDSRRAERVYTRIPIALLLGPEGATAERDASTFDVSPHGAKIITQATLTPGQTLVLLSYRKGAQPVRACVVWVSVEPGEPTQAGLEFVD